MRISENFKNTTLAYLPTRRLTLSEEKEFVEAGDLASLIEYTLREAFYYGKGCYQGKSLKDGIVLSAAYDALTSAAKRFDPNWGLRFFAYAKADLRGALCKAHRADDTVNEVRVLWRDDKEDEEEENNYVPTRAGQLPPWSEAPDYQAIFVKEEWAQIKPVLEQVLDARERMIIELNFIGGLNLREIADLVGVTRSDIHHGKAEALKKVRNRLMDQKRFSR